MPPTKVTAPVPLKKKQGTVECPTACKLGKKTRIGVRGGTYYITKGGNNVYCKETATNRIPFTEFVKSIKSKELREQARLLNIPTRGKTKVQVAKKVWQ